MTEDNEAIPQLPAVLSYVLTTGPDSSDAQAIKLALKELVLLGALAVRSIGKKRLGLLMTHTRMLFQTGQATADLPASLAAMLDGMSGQPKRDGVKVADLTNELVERYRDRGGFVGAVVVPEMEKSGLVERSAGGGSEFWHLTSAGQAAFDVMNVLQERAKAVSASWNAGDRDAAAALMQEAGATALLLSYPQEWVWEVVGASVRHTGSENRDALPGEHVDDPWQWIDRGVEALGHLRFPIDPGVND